MSFRMKAVRIQQHSFSILFPGFKRLLLTFLFNIILQILKPLDGQVQEYFSFDLAALAHPPKEKYSANKKNRVRLLARYIAGAWARQTQPSHNQPITIILPSPSHSPSCLKSPLRSKSWRATRSSTTQKAMLVRYAWGAGARSTRSSGIMWNWPLRGSGGWGWSDPDGGGCGVGGVGLAMNSFATPSLFFI